MSDNRFRAPPQPQPPPPGVEPFQTPPPQPPPPGVALFQPPPPLPGTPPVRPQMIKICLPSRSLQPIPQSNLLQQIGLHRLKSPVKTVASSAGGSADKCEKNSNFSVKSHETPGKSPLKAPAESKCYSSGNQVRPMNLSSPLKAAGGSVQAITKESKPMEENTSVSLRKGGKRAHSNDKDTSTKDRKKPRERTSSPTEPNNERKRRQSQPSSTAKVGTPPPKTLTEASNNLDEFFLQLPPYISFSHFLLICFPSCNSFLYFFLLLEGLHQTKFVTNHGILSHCRH